jgi:hypothetical protein
MPLSGIVLGNRGQGCETQNPFIQTAHCPVEGQAIFFDSAWVQTQGFVPSRQALHHFSHNSNSFYSDYFGDSVSHYAQVSLDCKSPILSFLP